MTKSLTLKLVARVVALPFVAYVVLFLPAGTFDYWEVYAYFGIFLIMAVSALIYFLKHDPEFLRRRLESKEKETTQKFVVVILALSVLAIYVTCGFDERYAWSEIPISMKLFGFFLVVVGYQLTVQVGKQNSFAARTIKVEESQQLVDTGLYGYVRHPMYSAIVLMYIGTPLALDSWWGLLPTLVFFIALIVRIANEEKVLLTELVGYAEYRERVRSRIIPGIW